MIKLRTKYKELNLLVNKKQYKLSVTIHARTFLIQKKLQQWVKKHLEI